MNILIINLKGGAAKSTNSSIIASYIDNSTLIEIDKINKSDKRITKDYKSIQLDFLNESDDKFLEFENLLLEKDEVRIIDPGAIKLEVFHKAMITASLYSTVDLLIIPAMDGVDDFLVAMSYLETIKDEIDAQKVMFSFNRYNENEYSEHQEQFNSFFNKKSEIKKNFGIDLIDENYYVLKDSRAIKISREKGITLKSLVDTNIEALTKQQRAETDRDKRLELTKERSLVLSAQNFYKEYVTQMLEKILKKLQK